MHLWQPRSPIHDDGSDRSGHRDLRLGLFTHVVQPTIPASLNNKIDVLSTENAAPKQSLTEKKERWQPHSRHCGMNASAASGSTQSWRSRGNPCSVDLDAVRLGDGKDKVMGR